MFYPVPCHPRSSSVLDLYFRFNCWSILKITLNPMESHNVIFFFLVHIKILCFLFSILRTLTLSKEPASFVFLYFFSLRNHFRSPNLLAQINFHQDWILLGLPWWRSGWESSCQCRGHGFEPWSGRIPHAAERLGPWATVAEPARLEPVPRNERGRDGGRPAHRDEGWPPLATTGEGPRTEMKTQLSHK